MYDIIIIGAGPAGLTAAIYGLRAGKKVLVLEGKAYGGQIVNAQKVENYPGIIEISGRDLAKNLLTQVRSLGGETKLENVVSLAVADNIKIVTTDMDERYRAEKIIIATGAENRKLGLAREEELTGHGVSYCATCDGHFYEEKDVAVIGGGNTALMDAIYLSALARKVYLIHRRMELRAEKAYVDEAKEKNNIEFVLGYNPVEIKGDTKVETLVVKSNENSPEPDKVREIPTDGIFIAVGYQPQNQAFASLIELDEAGYIRTADGVHTNIKGIYVAGDARAKELKQLTTAVSDGAIAATMAIQEV